LWGSDSAKVDLSVRGEVIVKGSVLLMPPFATDDSARL
jgi:hypothetical protein